MAKRILLEGCEALRDGQARRVDVGDLEIGVFCVGEKLFAIGDECPHQGASLSDGWAHEGVISCPWHGWQFDLSSGRCLTLPGYDVECYKIHIENGAVFLELEDDTASGATAPTSGAAATETPPQSSLPDSATSLSH